MPFSTPGGGTTLTLTFLTGVPGPHFSMDAIMTFLVVNLNFTKIHYYDSTVTLGAGSGIYMLNLATEFYYTDEVMVYVSVYENDAFTGDVLRRSRFEIIDATTWGPLA